MLGTTRYLQKLLAVVFAMLFLAAACSSDAPTPAAAIETNDGGISVQPPDVLAGDPIPSPDPLESVEEPSAPDTEPSEVVSADLSSYPPPVEGAPETPIVDFAWFDGAAGSTADFAGRPVVLNFWASNCAACIAEMPEFEEVHQALTGQVDFVGMNVADTREAAERLAAQTGVTYPLADDPTSDVFRQFGGFVMPTTVLINPHGQAVFTWSGVLNGEELSKLIDEHLLPGSFTDV